jgi:hypothetical protein
MSDAALPLNGMIKRIQDHLWWANLQGRSLRIVATIALLLAGLSPLLLLVSPPRDTVSTALATVLSASFLWLSGQSLMGMGLTHALRAGQLEDLELYLKTFGDKQVSPAAFLKVLALLQRRVLADVIQRGALNPQALRQVADLIAPPFPQGLRRKRLAAKEAKARETTPQQERPADEPAKPTGSGDQPRLE